MADVGKRNSETKKRDGSQSRNPIEQRAWQDSVRAAAEADKMSGPSNVNHFFLRQDGEGRQYPPYLPKGTVPYKTYGPFVNTGGGDVPRGNNTYIDFY